MTVANRAASQLSVLASLKVAVGQTPQLDATGSIAYEMRQVKMDMRPLDLEARTTAFIHQYLGGLFSGGDTSIRSFYTDLDNALTVATHNQSNHLGDMAVSMQLSLQAAVLCGWFQLRSASQLHADQMRLSLALQGVWKNLLPALYFQDLSQYQFSESVAALLVWSSLPISTSIDFDNPSIKRFNTDKDVFWDWPDVDLRRAVTLDTHTIATLAGRLSEIRGQILTAGSGNADFFAPSMAVRFVEMALNAAGDRLFGSLLFTEAELVRGATDALKQVSAGLAATDAAPTHAIKTLAKFAGALTDTSNQHVSTVYSGMSGRVVGPTLLVESSRALNFTKFGGYSRSDNRRRPAGWACLAVILERGQCRVSPGGFDHLADVVIGKRFAMLLCRSQAARTAEGTQSAGGQVCSEIHDDVLNIPRKARRVRHKREGRYRAGSSEQREQRLRRLFPIGLLHSVTPP